MWLSLMIGSHLAWAKREANEGQVAGGTSSGADGSLVARQIESWSKAQMTRCCARVGPEGQSVTRVWSDRWGGNRTLLIVYSSQRLPARQVRCHNHQQHRPNKRHARSLELCGQCGSEIVKSGVAGGCRGHQKRRCSTELAPQAQG